MSSMSNKSNQSGAAAGASRHPATPQHVSSQAPATAAAAGPDEQMSLSSTPTQSQVLPSGSTLSAQSSASMIGGAGASGAIHGGTGTLKAPHNVNTSFVGSSNPSSQSQSVEASPVAEKPRSAPPFQQQQQHRAELSSASMSANSTADGSQQSTISSSVLPRSAGYAQRASTIRQPQPQSSQQQQQRAYSLAGAPSDFETISGMSASSEFDSGDEDADLEDARSVSAGTSRAGGGGVGGRSVGGGAGAAGAPASSRPGRPLAKNFGQSYNVAGGVRSGSVSGLTTGGGSGGGAAAPAASTTASRRASAAANQRRDVSRKYRQYNNHGHNDDDDDRFGPLDVEDDEVHPRDLGEELVKRRMKARQREKALKKKKKAEEEEQQLLAKHRASVQLQQGGAQCMPPSSPLLANRSSTGTFPSSAPLSPGGGATASTAALEREGRPMHISIPSSIAHSDAMSSSGVGALLSPGSQAQISPGAIRSVSAAAAVPAYNVYPSPHGHIRRPGSIQNLASAYPQGGYPLGGSAGASGAGSRNSGTSYSAQSSAHQLQAHSIAHSHSRSASSSHGGTVVLGSGSGRTGNVVGGGQHSEAGGSTSMHDVFSDDGRTHSELRNAFSEQQGHHTSYYGGEAEEDYFDERRDALAGLAHERSVRGDGLRAADLTLEGDVDAGSEYDNPHHPVLFDDGVDDGESPIQGGEGHSSGDGEDTRSGGGDEDINPDDVEYTLKDRQDAINIEHPFGLPIWKPALYKKSRSVTRNAETALHSMPSAAAERHLLPGNILWTVLFGSWLSILSFMLSIFLNFIPNGGSKYARVLWELGSYIFWPFGKYVEVELSTLSGQHDSYVGAIPAGIGGFHGDSGAFDAMTTAGNTGYTPEPADADCDGTYENAFTPVAARFPHDHTHQVPFNSRPERARSQPPQEQPAESGSSNSNEGRHSTPRQSEGESSNTSHTATQALDESTPLVLVKGKGNAAGYGTIEDGVASSGALEDEAARIAREQDVYGYVYDDAGNDVFARQRYLGRIAYGIAYWLLVAPLMGAVCLLCWGGVFSVPMGKLTWVLLKNLAAQPLALHFRSALFNTTAAKVNEQGDVDEEGPDLSGDRKKAALRLLQPLRPGQLAPRSKSFTGTGAAHRRSKILLCTYRAVGAQYYKYTVGGVNILFVNTIPLVFFTIFDFFFLEPYVEHHHATGLLALIASQGVIFMMALGSVIPLSYFIGMAVASISAQSSIGMGAVINATFGSIIEIILYSIALTQNKAKLVEGSIIGSILAGVLLMPGLSMCSGATRRKEQRFNARSAGVTSTMLIMAIIGILTPTLFYQIYGTFQLTCEGCPQDRAAGETWTCRRCFYEHVPPATDPFFQSSVKGLIYTCTVILVLSYAIGLWFSLRTHASQIWQNPQPQHHSHTSAANAVPAPIMGASDMVNLPSAQRSSIYKRIIPASVYQQLLPTSQRPRSQSSQGATIKSASGGRRASTAADGNHPSSLHLPERFSEEDYARAVALTASAFQSAMDQQQQPPQSVNQAMPRSAALPRQSMHEAEEDEGGNGGHDAPSWSRQTSVSVLLACTVLYAIIAEVLVDVVDVVLDGSGIDEKFLGITLFALVPNTTEFMNAMSFAINGNIALSMEIGSAYALQVCLIQIPAMVIFSGYYNATRDFPDSAIHRTFTLIFPRWDVIAIIFSVFLLTYTYIEARSNYYRGSICVLSYLVLVAGFFYAPATGDLEMPPETPNVLSFMSFNVASGAFGAAPTPSSLAGNSAFGGLKQYTEVPTLHGLAWLGALFDSLFAR
ncbi:hypothetical protein K437DRAFT_254605 [Tilletiaria anomala UBC 951]|uniref:Calcium permease n=1 Tax=Tilletiaria anomala (strain ATCC 24038 / CBS 436.72 / UBC 951) TaxID=1037660 RepID=A0A066WN46_TILAU|nr:uncharacterized protein K437DRAFT_254605 [Tilletiaria anomala UBC 951]KDN52055.1 hypothetical protein K437DRAFT_254605 [Tilletiaria anomala UBC 951]